MVLIFGHSANVQLIRETSISISSCGRIQTVVSSLCPVDPSYDPKRLKLSRRFASTQCNAPHGWPQLGLPLARRTGTLARFIPYIFPRPQRVCLAAEGVSKLALPHCERPPRQQDRFCNRNLHRL